jgi:micrococcal nuclease
VLSILLACLALAGPPGAAEGADATAAPIPETARVVKVYDGDTFTLDTGDKVRLRWVNTPERRPPEPYADEARRLAERLVMGRTVRLLVSGEDARDGYGRLLAGLQVGRENLSIELIEAGYGHVFIIPPEDTDMAPFLAAQGRARRAMRGIWSTDRYRGALHITSFHANAPGPDEENVNGEYLRVCNVTTGPIDLQGFVLTNRAGRRFALPSLVVPAGHTVLIHSGRGIHQDDPSEQLHVYLGEPGPVWDNRLDEATLLDPAGREVDAVRHEVSER